MANWNFPGGGPLPSLSENADPATEAVPLGLVFKPSTAGSCRSPPRKKSWNQNNRLQGKIRPTSGASASTGQLSRPWSGVSDAQVSHTSTMSRSVSNPVLKSGYTKLPSLPKMPLTFEDLYKNAKKRATTKSSEGTRQKPSAPVSSSSQLAFALRNQSPAAMSIDVPASYEERRWAASTLKGGREADGQDSEGLPSRAGSKVSIPSISRKAHFTEDSDEPDDDTNGSKATSAGRVRSKMLSAAHRGLSTTSFCSRAPRQKSRLASEAYIKALRAMMEDGDYTRVDNFCSDIRVAIAGLSGSVQERLQVDESLGFGDDELQRIAVAFRRFKSPEAAEIHIDEMPQVLTFLGYMKADKAACQELQVGISNYSMLDYHEYVDFLEKFAIYEREEFYKEFVKFDTDESGMLNIEEVKELITSMGVTPLRDTMREAFDVIDFDGSGYLDFEEFVHFMTIYRVTEGFTRKEVHELKTMFDRVAIQRIGEAKAVPADRLGDVLARWFGPQSAYLAQKLARRFALGENATTMNLGAHPRFSAEASTLAVAGVEHDKHDEISAMAGSLEFAEFLLWCRRLREAEIKEFHKQFQAADTSGSGFVCREELGEMLHLLGYMPLRNVIDEILDQVDDDKNGELDFEEFVHLMGIFRKTDGFTTVEVAELTNVFHLYEVKEDETDDGRVDCLKLTDLLRGMGYVVNLDNVRRFIAEVDFDNTNSLDLSEFLRLMRLHRESELKKALEVFDENKEYKGPERRQSRQSIASVAREAYLPEIKMKKALSEVGYRPEENDLTVAIALLEATEGRELKEFDFDHFVSIIDSCRKALVGFRRRHAGFSEDELKKYAKAFHVYDENGNDTIERHELTKLLCDIGIPLRSKKEQGELLGKLDIAREIARKADPSFTEAEVGAKGSPSVTFHTMLFLLRMLQTATDEEEAALETDMVQATGFTPKEIAEFRDVFSFCAAKSIELDTPAKPTSPKKIKDEEKRISTVLDGEVKEIARNQTLTIEGMKRVVRSLGMQITNKEAHLMEDKLDLIAAEIGDTPSPDSPTSPSPTSPYASTMSMPYSSTGSSSPRKPGKYTFFNFLVFMRWMLDTNFCSINECVQEQQEES